MAWADGSNSRARSPGVRPDRTSATTCCRNAAGYGGLVFDIADTSSSQQDQVSAELDQLHPDPAAIATAAGLPNEAEVRRNLAATTTSKQAELHDRLTGYQVLGGADYALSDAVSKRSVGAALARLDKRARIPSPPPPRRDGTALTRPFR